MSNLRDVTRDFSGRVGFQNHVLVIDLTDSPPIEELYHSRLADALGTLIGAREVLLKVRGRVRVRLHKSKASEDVS